MLPSSSSSSYWCQTSHVIITSIKLLPIYVSLSHRGFPSRRRRDSDLLAVHEIECELSFLPHSVSYGTSTVQNTVKTVGHVGNLYFEGIVSLYDSEVELPAPRFR